MELKEIDTFNKFGVAMAGGGIVLLMPPSRFIPPDDALILAAYLVSMAEHMASHEFSEVLNAVRGS